MVTKEFNAIRNTTDVGEAAITMAIGIVIERISRISAQDKRDLFELVKGLASVQCEEDVEAIRSGMVEILDQEQYRGVPLKFDPADSPAALTKWKEFVASRIRTLREAAGKTQTQLADQCGLAQSHISRIENAELSPSHRTIERIAKALDVEPGAIDPAR
jgi:DNA-binding XRE family transcriptional regulator